MTNLVIPVIISGGSGTRLWPLSTKNLPKQFIPLLDQHSLFQDTVIRIADIPQMSSPIIVCNQKHHHLVEEQLDAISKNAQAIILEPIGRNTAPAIALAAMQALQIMQDPILLIFPADLTIKNISQLHTAILVAQQYAEKGLLVTFGIKPAYPETGYGYIKCAQQLDQLDVYKIEKFVEKPDIANAKKYIATGLYYWNSGMFIFRASTFLKELQNFAPQIYSACVKVFANIIHTNNCLLLPEKEFATCPSNSIDYAIMEQTKNAVMVTLDAGWSDIGSWHTLWEHSAKNIDGNVTIGNTILHDVKNSYIRAEKRRLITIGVDDIVIIETNDTVLVIHKDRCQDIKQVLEEINKEDEK